MSTQKTIVMFGRQAAEAEARHAAFERERAEWRKEDRADLVRNIASAKKELADAEAEVERLEADLRRTDAEDFAKGIQKAFVGPLLREASASCKLDGETQCAPDCSDERHDTSGL
jgi:uncharacterized protein (DUF3084 family)